MTTIIYEAKGRAREYGSFQNTLSFENIAAEYRNFLIGYKL
jgi:hypothetical protein